jgi:hypothetical protein
MSSEILPGYTRVTDVLFPFSGLKAVDPEILRKAAERGTKVHEICDALIEEIGVGQIDPSLSGYVASFESWYEGKLFIPKPKRFYCDTYKITGECDAVYIQDGHLILVDFKTPVKESKTWKLQASAYSYLAEKNGYQLKRLEFVKLCKQGNEAQVFLYKENFDLFLKCLEVYREFFEGAEQENFLDYL